MELMIADEIDMTPFTSEQIGNLYKICPSHLKRMSKDLICVILAGFIQQARETRKELSLDGAVKPPSIVPIEECLPFDELHSLLRDLRVTATFVNQILISEKCKQPAPVEGYVYVAKFDDNHIKIGSSLYPQKRLRQVSRGNQARLIDSWVSDASVDYKKIEKSAHEHFKTFRVGGEFFVADMKHAAQWIKGEMK